MEEENQKKSQNDAQPAAADAPVSEPTELQKTQAQRDEYLNSWKRSAADFINYKKEEGKRFTELASYAAVDFAKDLLPVLDSFELGLNAIEKDSAAYKGMLMIRGQLQEALKKKGIERIVVARGDTFKPELHEAMMEEEIPPNDPDKDKLAGKILEELVSGYCINSRVIRAAKVKIGK